MLAEVLVIDGCRGDSLAILGCMGEVAAEEVRTEVRRSGELTDDVKVELTCSGEFAAVRVMGGPTPDDSICFPLGRGREVACSCFRSFSTRSGAGFSGVRPFSACR